MSDQRLTISIMSTCCGVNILDVSGLVLGEEIKHIFTKCLKYECRNLIARAKDGLVQKA